MPIFEFICKKCDSPFEKFIRGQETILCPSCKSKNVKKVFSSFSTRAGTPSIKDFRTTSCGGGNCGDPRGAGACSQ